MVYGAGEGGDTGAVGYVWGDGLVERVQDAEAGRPGASWMGEERGIGTYASIV